MKHADNQAPRHRSDAFKSAKWDELTAGRSFAQSDDPALSLLCQWYKIADAAQEELDNFGGQTSYSNEVGDLKAGSSPRMRGTLGLRDAATACAGIIPAYAGNTGPLPQC